MAAPYQQVMAKVSGIQIKEKVRALEALSAAIGQEIEMANKYKVLDQDGQELFFAVEQTDFCGRQLKQCCNDCAAWDVDILYTQGGRSDEAFKMHRDTTLTCCCLNRPTVKVSSAQGGEIGSISNPCSICNLVFDIADATGDHILSIDGSACQCGLLCPCPCGPCAEVNFDVNDASGNQVGTVTKKVPGCCKFFIADDVDNYHVDFDSLQDPTQKILLMAASIFMDFRYFSNNSSDDNSGGGLLGGLVGAAVE